MKRTGKTLNWQVVDKNNTFITNYYAQDHIHPDEYGQWGFQANERPLTRKTARILKNFLNSLIPERAPYRIVQTVITK